MTFERLFATAGGFPRRLRNSEPLSASFAGPEAAVKEKDRRPRKGRRQAEEACSPGAGREETRTGTQTMEQSDFAVCDEPHNAMRPRKISDKQPQAVRPRRAVTEGMQQ